MTEPSNAIEFVAQAIWEEAHPHRAVAGWSASSRDGGPGVPERKNCLEQAAAAIRAYNEWMETRT